MHTSIVTEPFLPSEGREGLDKDDTMRNIKSANFEELKTFK